MREDKDSDNEDEVALVESLKKGGGETGGGDKPRRKNPNKDETCNHFNKKRHIKSNCWTKHPDKKQKSVKSRKGKQEGKSSIAAGALVDNEEEIILTAVEDENQYMYLNDKKVFRDEESIVEEVYTSKMQTVDITNAYHFCPVLGSVKYFEEEELLEELDEEESEEEFLSNNDEHAIKFNRNNDDNNCNNQGCITSIEIVGNTQMQANSKQKSSDEAGANFCFSSLNFGHLTEFNLVTFCKNGDIKLTFQALESENVWILDTRATSHVTKHKIRGINQRGTTVKPRGIIRELINLELEMDILVKYIGKDGLEINAELKDMQVNKNFNFNLFSMTKMLKKGYLLSGNKKCMKLKKGAHEFTFESVIRTRGGALYCAIFKRQETNSQRALMWHQLYRTAPILKARKKRQRRFSRSTSSKPMSTWDILVKTQQERRHTSLG